MTGDPVASPDLVQPAVQHRPASAERGVKCLPVVPGFVSAAQESARAQDALSPVEYLRPEQLAAMLQVSPKSVYRWAAQDATMPALRLGGVVRFPRERILAWLRSREQGLGRPRRSRKPTLGGPESRAIAAVPTSENSSCATPCAEEAL